MGGMHVMGNHGNSNEYLMNLIINVIHGALCCVARVFTA